MREKIFPRTNVILSVVLLISLVMVNHVQASETEYKELQTTTYRFLQYVKEGHDRAAVAALEELKSVNEKQSIFSNTKISTQEINSLINETQLALQDSKSTTKEKYHMSLTIVLLYDAIWNNEDALWVTWKLYLEDEIDRLVQSGDVSNASIHHLYTLYERLIPALKVSLDEEEYRMMQQHRESFLAFLSGGSQQDHISFINTLSQDLEKIPAVKEKEKSFTEEPGFIWLLFSVGSLIISTLMYVGWRKYKGENEKNDKRRERGS